MELLRRDIAQAEEFVRRTLRMRPEDVRPKRRRRTARKQQRVVQMKAELQTLRESEEARVAVKSFERMFDDIHTIPRVRWLSVGGDELLVSTDMLYGKRFALPRTWHKIGEFTITIPFSNPFGMKWTNHSHSYFEQGVGYWSAPQILNGAKNCFGPDASTIIQKADKENDLKSIVEVAVRSCETQGVSSHVDLRLQYWPVVPDPEVPEWYLENFGKTGEPHE